jgi:hypothetical protein
MMHSLILCLSAAALAQSADGPAKAPPDKLLREPKAGALRQGDLERLTFVHGDREDLGKLPVGSTAHRSMVFVNTKDHPVYVKVISTTCGCTSADFSALTVPPKESVSLNIKVKVPAVTVSQEQAVRFAVSDTAGGDAETAVAFVRYTPDAQIEVHPASVSISTFVDAPVHLPVSFRQSKSFEFPTNQIALDIPGASLSAAREIDIKPELAALVRVATLSLPARKCGTFTGSLKAGGDPERSPVHIPIRVRVREPYATFPRGVRAGDAAELRQGQQFVFQPLCENPPKPVICRVIPADAHLEAKLAADGLSFRLTPTVGLPPVGGATVEVVDAAGRTICSVPVAWGLNDLQPVLVSAGDRR